jgi:hypothetical protein
MAVKFISAILLNVALAYAAYLYGHVVPWWIIAPGAFLVALVIPMRPWPTWLSGFLGVFLCWLALAWQADEANNHLLSAKIAAVLPLGGQSWALLLAAGVVGGLVAGFAGLSGSYLRRSKAKKL